LIDMPLAPLGEITNHKLQITNNTEAANSKRGAAVVRPKVEHARFPVLDLVIGVCL